jgi:hypothetical protein
MKFAFHKEKKTLFEKLCSWKMQGPYTHVEAMFGPDPVNPALTVCGSSKFTDGGVRITSLDLSDTVNTWDILEVQGIDEAKSLQWFKDHSGEPYDTRGLIQFITFFPVGHNPKGWFCDEACLASIGMTEAYRFDPNGMNGILLFLKEYVAGNPNAAVVTITNGELADVKMPVNPVDEIQLKINQALPAVEGIAHTAEMVAPFIAMIPGGAPVAAAVAGVSAVVDKITDVAPTLNATIDALQAAKAK